MLPLEQNVRGCKPKKPRADLSQTEYQLLRRVVREAGWKVFKKKQDKPQQVILVWRDTYLPFETFRRLLPDQRINRFPGSYQLGKKSNLTINLRKIPQSVSFYPRTWVLPIELAEFRKQSDPSRHYIAKPQAGCQGRGIVLVGRPCSYNPLQTMVVQEYVADPLLVDELKFDLRLYVLLASLSPLKIYLFKEGLARFATKRYSPAATDNFDPMVHLTNYAINKRSPAFVFNNNPLEDGVGHKRSFSSVLALLAGHGRDVACLLAKVKRVVIETMLAAQGKMRQHSKGEDTSRCFQVFGFDILLKEDLSPVLLQVNHTPSFCTDSPLDLKIKKALIIDALRVTGLSSLSKKQQLFTSSDKLSFELIYDHVKDSRAYHQAEVPVSGVTVLLPKARTQPRKWQAKSDRGSFKKQAAPLQSKLITRPEFSRREEEEEEGRRQISFFEYRTGERILKSSTRMGGENRKQGLVLEGSQILMQAIRRLGRKSKLLD